MEFGGLGLAFVFPGGDVAEGVVVAEGFAFFGLEFFAQVAAAGFFALEGVNGHDLGELHVVGDAEGELKLFGVVIFFADDADVVFVFGAQGLDFLDGFLEVLAGAGDTDLIPHDIAEGAVEVGDGAGAFGGEEGVDAGLDVVFGLFEGIMIGCNSV